MFSAIFVTRSLLRAIIGAGWINNPVLFGMELPRREAAPAPTGPLRIRRAGGVES
jgi:hypothetical protein